MKIHHLKRDQINNSKWNDTVEKSSMGMPYAYTWYLDTVSPNWEALVTEHYSYVMPLPKVRKGPFSYLSQPHLTQQLGIFSDKELTSEIVTEFIAAIPYLSYEFHLNELNSISGSNEMPNYVLDLNKPYEQLFANYSNNTKRNINKSQNNGLTYQKLQPQEFIGFWYSTHKKWSQELLEKMRILVGYFIVNRKADIYGVYNNAESLVAALLLAKENGRLIYLMPASTDTGKDLFAMFYLVDEIIKKHAETQVILDFEGSKIEGVARFYKGFGATNRPYFLIKKNRPEWLIKLLQVRHKKKYHQKQHIKNKIF